MRAGRATRIRAVARRPEEFGGDDHVFAGDPDVAQRLARDLFRQTFRINIAGIDEVDAGIDRGLDQAVSVILLQTAHAAVDAAPAAEGHGAEAEFGNEQAGAAEDVIAHGALLSETKGQADAALWQRPPASSRRIIASFCLIRSSTVPTRRNLA